VSIVHNTMVSNDTTAFGPACSSDARQTGQSMAHAALRAAIRPPDYENQSAGQEPASATMAGTSAAGRLVTEKHTPNLTIGKLGIAAYRQRRARFSEHAAARMSIPTSVRDSIHRALHGGFYWATSARRAEYEEYNGPPNTKFLFPGSGLFGRRPPW